MRDYVAWYLIELRRRLRTVEPQQKVEDFLLETRTHLSESIDEMTSRGITEEAATKSAISDFGDPGLVSQVFRGKSRISSRAYWILVAVISVLAVPAFVQLVLSATDNALGYVHVTTFDFGLAAAAAFVGIAAVGFMSRRWCVLPIAGVGLLVTLGAGLWVMRSADVYASKSDPSRFVVLTRSAAESQVRVRDKWLDDYAEVVPNLSLAISEASNDRPDKLLAIIRSEVDYAPYIYPEESRSGSSTGLYAYPATLPGLESYRGVWINWLSLDERGRARYNLRASGDREEAIKFWRERGAAYLQVLKEQREQVLQDRELFLAPSPVQSAAVAQRVVLTPLLTVLLYSLLGMAVNGIVIVVADSVAWMRRSRWRRQLT